MKWFHFIILTGLHFSLLATPTPQPMPSVNDVNQVASGLFCPVCNSVTLDICSERVCADMRELIRTLLIQGYSNQEIQDYFVDQYGATVLVDPSTTSWGWALYTIPSLGLVTGIIIWYMSLRNKQKYQSLDITIEDHDPEDERPTKNDFSS